MLLLSAWQPSATFDPSKAQRVRTLYLPNAGEYRSIYWDKADPGKASVLDGVLPDNRFAQAGVVLALAGAAWFGFRKLQTKGLMGLGRPRSRKPKRKSRK